MGASENLISAPGRGLQALSLICQEITRLGLVPFPVKAFKEFPVNFADVEDIRQILDPLIRRIG
jgi:hypothetical protein